MRGRFWQWVRGAARRNHRALLALAFALALTVPLVGGRVAGIEPVGATTSATGATGMVGGRAARVPITGDAVTAAFRASRLPVVDLRQEPVARRGPSGAPATEREVWAFRVPGVEPSGGRILVFADDVALQQKADWFRRVGAGQTITIHGNVILWLDPAISAPEASRYRAAVTRL